LIDDSGTEKCVMKIFGEEKQYPNHQLIFLLNTWAERNKSLADKILSTLLPLDISLCREV
jgi:hypothetical protein